MPTAPSTFLAIAALASAISKAQIIATSNSEDPSVIGLQSPFVPKHASLPDFNQRTWRLESGNAIEQLKFPNLPNSPHAKRKRDVENSEALDELILFTREAGRSRSRGGSPSGSRPATSRPAASKPAGNGSAASKPSGGKPSGAGSQGGRKPIVRPMLNGIRTASEVAGNFGTGLSGIADVANLFRSQQSKRGLEDIGDFKDTLMLVGRDANQINPSVLSVRNDGYHYAGGKRDLVNADEDGEVDLFIRGEFEDFEE